MAKRSLSASSEGRKRAKQAFERTGWTQEYLAAEVGLFTRQSVWKFFSGRPIDRSVFMSICERLNLNWEEIVDRTAFTSTSFEPEEPVSPSLLETVSAAPSEVAPHLAHISLDELVQYLRENLREALRAQCSVVQSIFDLSQPRRLEQIYTPLQVLPRLNHERWLEVADLQRPDQSGRVNLQTLNAARIPAIAIVDRYPKLVILGKPGAGKTTFLQHLAISSDEGKYYPNSVPLFIQLRHFVAEAQAHQNFSLLDYIHRRWLIAGISHAQTEQILQAGRALLLLDALDEIPPISVTQTLASLQEFFAVYFENAVILTCRLASQEYFFRGFHYVELSDFDDQSIATFAKQWFAALHADQQTNYSSPSSPPLNQATDTNAPSFTNSLNEEFASPGELQAQRFLDALNRPENQAIRELGVTPILLNLICSVYQERQNFPLQRAKLYQAGLDTLLVRWDNARGIQRDHTYRNLSLADKIKLLSQIAAELFEAERFFFEKEEVLTIIARYLEETFEGAATSDHETLRLDSEAVLRSITLQHGLLIEQARDIYSFSHLTFQEYFTARKIAASPSPVCLDLALKNLADRVFNVRWREVILLTASLVSQADQLLCHLLHRIQQELYEQPDLMAHLAAIHTKVSTCSPGHPLQRNPAAMRAFYFTLFNQRDLNLAIALEPRFANELPPDLALDLALARTLMLAENLCQEPIFRNILSLSFNLELNNRFNLDAEFVVALSHLKAALPDPRQNKGSLAVWWQTEGEKWVQQFKRCIFKYRHFAAPWPWTRSPRMRWGEVYQAYCFLLACLDGDTQVSAHTRSYIVSQVLALPTQPAPLQTIDVNNGKNGNDAQTHESETTAIRPDDWRSPHPDWDARDYRNG